MKLNEIIQSKTELKLEKIERPLVFNNVTLADQAWLDDNYTNDELVKVFTDMKVNDILKIAVRFLDDRSRETLSKIKIIERDEYGEELESKKYKLEEKLFHTCSQSEFVDLIRVLFEVRNKAYEQIKNVSEKFQKKSEITEVPTGN